MALFGSPQLSQPGAPILAPSPTQAGRRPNPNAEQNTLLGQAPDTTRARSDAMSEAQKAAQRQQKKARAAGRTVITGQPVGSGINPPPVFAPRTLLGGSY